MADRKTPFPVWAALAPFLLALATRAAYLAFWLDSPFRNYHQVAGLDMQKHAAMAQDAAGGADYNSLYVLLLSLPYKLGLEDGSIVAMVSLQLLMGAASAGLIGYVAARFFRNVGWGALAGCLFAVYAPPLVYEGALLKETLFLFTNVLSLAFVVNAIDQRHSAKALFAAGMALALPPLVRFLGLAWAALGAAWLLLAAWRQLRRSGAGTATMAGRLGCFALGAAAILALVIIHNHGNACGFKLSVPYLEYIYGVATLPGELSTNPTPPADDVEPQRLAPPTHLLTKFLHLLRADELPDNLNYFFVKFRVAPLAYLLGPWLLMPLAMAGLPLLLARRSRAVRASLLLTYAVAYAVPLTFFMPLGRYKIQLLPLYCVAAVFLLRYCRAMARRRRWLRLALPAGLCLAAFGANWAAQEPSKLRSSDFHAYAIALSHQGAGPEEVESNLLQALELRPSSIKASVMLAQLHMGRGDFELARQIAAPLHRSHPDNHAIALAYASALLGMRQAAEAESVLRRLGEPKDGDRNRKTYLYNLGECRLLQGDLKAAAQLYVKAAECVEPFSLDQAILERLKLVGALQERDKQGTEANANRH